MAFFYIRHIDKAIFGVCLLLYSFMALGDDGISNIWEKPPSVGIVIDVDKQIIEPGGKPVKLRLFRDVGVEWARVLLKPVDSDQLNATKPWKVKISDSTNYEFARINGIGLRTQYSPVLTAHTIFLSVPEGGVPVKIMNIINGSSTNSLESVFGDVNLRVIFEETTIIQESREGLVFLSFTVGEKKVSCNGFLLSKHLIATNEHCINNDEIILNNNYPTVKFDFKNKSNFGQEIRVIGRIKGINADLDMALLKLDEVPGNVQKRILGLTSTDERLTKESALRLVQHHHPSSWEVRSSYDEECRIVDVKVKGKGKTYTDFGYKCDAARGTSGAPVLRASDGAVVGLHRAGSIPYEYEYNKAVRGEILIDEINRLAKTYPDDFDGLRITEN